MNNTTTTTKTTASCKHGDAECGWCSSVEKVWRRKFNHDGPYTPSVAEMERMLDAEGWGS